MRTNYIYSILCFFMITLLLMAGCATHSKKNELPTAYLNHMPQSILVLPPQNESVVVEAPYIYLSTITEPIAEKGYYVYPVAVIDQLMKENGVPNPEDMARVPIEKIKEIIGPDAVLYITIKDWGTKYLVIGSTTVVQCEAQLIDTDTKTILWKGEHKVSYNPNQNSNSLAELLVSALISQIFNSVIDPSRDVARMTNTGLFSGSSKGFLFGKRHPGYEMEQQKWQNTIKQQADTVANEGE